MKKKSLAVILMVFIILTSLQMPSFAQTIYEREPNNSASQGDAVSVGDEAYGRISSSTDEDWYYFAAGGDVTITLSDLPADYDLYIYYWNGSYLNKSVRSGTQSESITYFASSTVKIRVVPKGSSYDPNAYYKLSVQWAS